MSQSILQRSKFLCFFEIDEQFKSKIVEDIYKPNQLPLLVYHFHYSSVYFLTLFNHFKVYFNQKITPNHLRLKYKGKQLPYDLPIGLFIPVNQTIQVTVSEWACPDGFKLMMISWKKGYTIVNREGGCDHVFKKLDLSSQMQLYNLHLKGSSHGLHKITKYQGNAIALRILIENTLIQRMQADLTQSIDNYIKKQFPALNSYKYEVLCHNIKIDAKINLKDLLEEWNYNDGFCYLKIQLTNDK